MREVQVDLVQQSVAGDDLVFSITMSDRYETLILVSSLFSLYYMPNITSSIKNKDLDNDFKQEYAYLFDCSAF